MTEFNAFQQPNLTCNRRPSSTEGASGKAEGSTGKHHGGFFGDVWEWFMGLLRP